MKDRTMLILAAIVILISCFVLLGDYSRLFSSGHKGKFIGYAYPTAEMMNHQSSSVYQPHLWAIENNSTKDVVFFKEPVYITKEVTQVVEKEVIVEKPIIVEKKVFMTETEYEAWSRQRALDAANSMITRS